MIQSFKSNDAKSIFEGQRCRKFSADIQKMAYRKLVLIHAAVEIADLRIPPGNRLEQLKGDRKGQYSIRVNDQWRICFKWQNGNVLDVDIVDYH